MAARPCRSYSVAPSPHEDSVGTDGERNVAACAGEQVNILADVDDLDFLIRGVGAAGGLLGERSRAKTRTVQNFFMLLFIPGFLAAVILRASSGTSSQASQRASPGMSYFFENSFRKDWCSGDDAELRHRAVYFLDDRARIRRNLLVEGQAILRARITGSVR